LCRVFVWQEENEVMNTTVTFTVSPTANEIFAAVCIHLAQQKRESAVIESGSRSCRYRNENGDRCALGIFIPDDAYSPKMEGCDVYGLVKSYWRLPEWISDHVGLLDTLQQCHDYATSAVGLKRELRQIAVDYSLDPSPADAITEFVCIGTM
jgi:hypothetical protein